MTAQQPSPPAPCVHCGQPSTEPVYKASDVFCCNGCLRVHELLNQETCPLPPVGKTHRSYAYLDLKDQSESFIRRDGEGHSQVVFFLPDMSCASCVQFLELLHQKHEGILRSEVNFPRKEVRVRFDDQLISLGAVATALADSGYPPELRKSDDKTQKKRDFGLVTKIGIAGFCFGNIMLMSFPEYLGADELEEEFRNAFGWLNMLLSIPVVLYSGRSYITSAWKAFRNRTVNIDVPITIGIFALFGRSAWEVMTGYGIGYFDSLAGLIFFLLIGKWYQARTYGALSYDRDYKSYFPIAVLRKEGATETFVPIAELRPGDEIIIHHREIVPADCSLLTGDARIDYSFVTGESDPIRIPTGDDIQAGGRQMGASITAVVRKPVEQSKLTRLWNSEAFKKDARTSIEDPVNRISKHFTWVVITIALGAFIYWLPKDPSIAWNALAATLIVACPCALALTIPFTFGSVMRLMGRSGLYLKNASVIEVMSRIRHLVFDKTGTLTRANDYRTTWHGASLSEHERSAVMLWAGLTLGLITGLHCIGMCGPLVLALPGKNQSVLQRWTNRLNYHLGRSLVYALLGGLAGVIGHGIGLFTWQRSIAIVGGSMMVLFAVIPKLTHGWSMPEPLRKPIDNGRSKLFRNLNQGNLFSWVGLGAINGLLPCGPLYIALAGALAVGTWEGGALFMFLFGMGTMVALFTLHFIRDRVQPFTKRLAPILTWATALIGILLVLRGLDLGIPFISPSQDIIIGSAGGCH